MLQSKPKDGMVGIPMHLVDEEGLQYVVDRSSVTAAVSITEVPSLAEAALSSPIERLDDTLLEILGLGRRELEYGMISARCLIEAGAISIDQLSLAIPMERFTCSDTKLVKLAASYAVSEEGNPTQSMRDTKGMHTGPMGDMKDAGVGLVINDRKSELWMIGDMCSRCTEGLQKIQNPNHCVPLGEKCSDKNAINLDREA